MELIIVRHGETEANTKGAFLGLTDVCLNENGLRQAHAAAKKIGKLKVDSIYSSPLKRAAKTAEIIASELGCSSISYSDDLKERNFGKWDGLTIDEIKDSFPEEYPLWIKDADYCMKNGENVDQVKQRIKQFLREVCRSSKGPESAPDDSVHVIVTHLGCIRYMIAFLLGLPDEFSWRFRVDNGSLTRVCINEEGYAYLTLLNG